MSNPPPSIVRRRLLAAGALALLPLPAPARSPSSPLDAGALAPLLAGVYTGQVDPALCLVSEKYDGVRALWDGRVLRHRSGRAVAAPAAFLAALPHEPLDGELWLGRRSFDALSAIVRRAEPRAAEWSRVRYMVFEMPAGDGSFAEWIERLTAVVARLGARQLEVAPQRRIGDRAELARALDAVVGAGGEGLMLHLASAPYRTGRSDALLKLKPYLDAEAVVVGHRPGIGKLQGLAGALEVESPERRRFFIGSGMSDALRREPPAIGSVITYRYRDLTPAGLPRFATYLRRHEVL
jgi:DNA ligase-1